MKRTRPLPLVLLALLGGTVGFLLQLSLASSGRAILVPPFTLPLTLVVVAALVLAFAVPIFRAIRGPVRREVNPFRAMRVVVLAKASSHVGSLMAGLGLGWIAYLLSRPIIPGVSSLWLSIAAAAGGVILLVAALVAEQLCALPPDDYSPDDVSAGGEHP